MKTTKEAVIIFTYEPIGIQLTIGDSVQQFGLGDAMFKSLIKHFDSEDIVTLIGMFKGEKQLLKAVALASKGLGLNLMEAKKYVDNL